MYFLTWKLLGKKNILLNVVVQKVLNENVCYRKNRLCILLPIKRNNRCSRKDQNVGRVDLYFVIFYAHFK